MQWRFWKKRNRVLIVGYSPKCIGGVTKIMGLLCESIPYLELHVALRYYRPLWKVVLFSIYSLVAFVLRLLVAPPRVIQVIVGSRGDAIRMLPYILLGRIRGCNVCLHFHKNIGAIIDDYAFAMRRCILSVWRLANAYCFLSNRLRDEFGDQLNSRNPHVVISNPISKKWLRQGILPRSERTHDLVFLGRWSHEKGNEDLLAVMRTLRACEPVLCDIYSDHFPKKNLENCVFHGWLEENDVQKVLRESKILLLPSYAEAYPTVLLEAAACGTPFVATNLAGIPDIVEDSQAGLLHEVGDVEGMREAIVNLLKDETLWTNCSHNGGRWVASLEVSKVVPKWHQFYTNLGVKVPLG